MPEDGHLQQQPVAQAELSRPVFGRTGYARLEAALSPAGKSFLRRQDVCYPFHICRPFYFAGDPNGMATVYLQSCAGGIFDGDDLQQAVSLEENSGLHVTTQASTIVHETPVSGAEQRTELRAAAGCFLEFLPDPLILFPGARVKARLAVELDPTATAILSDSFLCHDPSEQGRVFDHLFSETKITITGKGLVALDRFAISGSDLQGRLTGANGQYVAQGSMVIIPGRMGPDTLLSELQATLANCPGAYAMASRLSRDAGIWLRILARDAVALRRIQRMVWITTRRMLVGREPAARSK
ncbi:urease accessory protein UreD [Dongia soli]|uniref:Urease accessory protein UreD n=1 Tax=Dongia soli TaxID=600628 RepID=A0ABU5EBU2_9PROT|nr:urease accessory protein UreD [Dongia soli]MDY0883742.1 urease accessory protein UreD [Dongia soli]